MNFLKKNKKKITKRGYSKKDCVHPSIYVFYNEKNGFFIDYQPSKTDAKNVKYIYKGQESGIRYGEKSYKEFVEYNNVCIIKLKATKKNLYDFLKECCSDGASWTERNFNYEFNNCCHFIIKALEVLNENLETGNIEKDVIVIDSQINNQLMEENKKKEDIIPTKLLEYFNQGQIETDFEEK